MPRCRAQPKADAVAPVTPAPAPGRPARAGLGRRAAALVALFGAAVAGLGACAEVGEQASGMAAPVAVGPVAGSTTGPTSPTSAPRPSTTTTIEPVRATFQPAPGAVDVRPDTSVQVTFDRGLLTSLTVAAPTGPVPGTTLRGVFTPSGGLGFGQAYTVTAKVVVDGDTTTLRSNFTTLAAPPAEITADVFPFEGDVVGVGMPVIVTFSSPVPPEARAALTARFAVTSTPAVEGGWRWIDESTMHWRPRTYWPGGTVVTVAGAVGGVAVGEEWFTAPVARTFSIGPSHRITIDALTHQMVAYVDGVPVRTMPISTGKDAYPTASGVDLIMEKHDWFEMDSSSVGIGGSEAYLVTVASAQRLTYSGTFIHAAPWNSLLGEANTSHGCINASDEDAAWMMEFTLIGDPVEISGTPEQVSWGNGWGDWNIPFEQWPSTELA